MARLLRSLGLGIALLSTLAVPARADGREVEARVQRLLRRVPLVDGHNDLPWRLREKVRGRLQALDISQNREASDTLQTDLVRLRQGGVGAQIWSVYVPADLPQPEAVVAVVEQIDVVHRMVQRHPEVLELALTADDIEGIHKRGRIASLIGVEGGHCLDNSLAVLRQLYALGARTLTLTHSKNTDWADACSDEPVHGGLTPFGVELVREMNRLGMLVDLSHVSPPTMHAALDAAAAPVMFTHSAAFAVNEHVRNVPDDVLRRLPANGGVVMVTFVPRFVSREVMAHDAEEDAEKARLKMRYPGHKTLIEEHLATWRQAHPAPRATVPQVADHIAHIVQVAGIDHVGLGSDFDGIPQGPLGLEGVADFPNLLAELFRRGMSERDVEKITGRNALRVLRQAERVAARLRAERGPSELLIEP